jgi:hypothetical protein
MLAHLANPWILARLALGAGAAVLAAIAAVAAVGVLRFYRTEAPADERTLTLERRSELMATTLSLAFGLQIAAATLTVLASDRLAGSIRGAMCAFGVVGSSRWGARAVQLSLVSAMACAAWLATRRVDVRLQRGSLVRSLAALALVVTALLGADLAASAAYFLGLDLDVVATCCSVFVDAPSAGRGAIGDAGARTWSLVGGAAAAGLALGAGVLLARRATIGRGLAVAALGLVGGVVTLRAVTDVVAPYVYEAPNHRCAYCLLRHESAPAGPVLLAALLLAELCGAGAFAVVPLVRKRGAQRAALDVLERIGRASAVAWALVLVAGAYPIVRYALSTGTLRLFR